MKIPFKPIGIEDRDIITSFTIPSNYKNCDYSFANICSWRFLYDSEFAIVDGCLLIRFWIENKTRVAYMTPTGQGNLKQAIDLLEADSLEQGHPLCMLGVTPDAKEELEKAIPGGFFYIPERDYFDYIYLREDLATLKGKKYQAKRNHINNFNKKYSYKYIPITPELVPECLQLECKWYKANREDNDEEDLNDERRSIIYALNHYDELGLIGGAICVDHQIVAFTFGAPINHDTFGVHVEKANVNYEGAYAVINKEFQSIIQDKGFNFDENASIQLTSYAPNKLEYKTSAADEQLAVFSEVYYPKGWNVYVDGKPGELFRADYILRAMIVPAGEHVITFEYKPQSYFMGAKISAISSGILLLALLGCIAYYMIRNYKKKD